jgi:endonuclease/exonuclease/phosphatase family metal-dependent hydrolase
MCTHFDHIGQTAREESAKLLGRIATDWQNSTSEGEFVTPVFLGGDLNITPDNQAYKDLVAPGNMYDTRDLVPGQFLHGHVNRTFTGFTDATDGGRIDHLFVKDTTGLSFLSWAVLENRFDDRIYSSDHRSVVVEAQFSVETVCRK